MARLYEGSMGSVVGAIKPNPLYSCIGDWCCDELYPLISAH